MIRNGRTYNLLKKFVQSSEIIFLQNSRHLTPIREYAKGSGKGSKGQTAKPEDCVPTIKIPAKPPECPPPVQCKENPSYKYKECLPGGLRNPVVQVCEKPNMMEDCSSKKPPMCPPEKGNTLRNVLIFFLLLGMMTAWYLYNYGNPEPPPDDALLDDEALKRRRVRKCLKNPKSGKELPKTVPYLLIGGGTAAFSAFRSIKSLDPTAQVLVVTSECENPYMRPPLSKELWFNNDAAQVEKLMFKQWNGTVRSVYYEPLKFYTAPNELLASSKGGVAVATGWTVKKIDPYERQATLDDGTVITYGKCLIATGSKTKKMKLFERDSPALKARVQYFRDIFDFKDLYDVMKAVDSVAIIGGGFLGSELACALARWGRPKNLEVTQIFKEKGNMGKVLPEYLSLWTTKKVEAEGVTVIAGGQVIDAKVQDGKLLLTTTTGGQVLVDHCIIAIGADPNTDLAEPSLLETDGEKGGYLVNAELEARSHLFIAGDAASFFDTHLGRRRVEHHDHAVVSGRLAGENMLGAGKPYLHQSMFWSDLGPDVGYEAIGLVDSKLPTVGVYARKTENDTPKAVVAATDDNLRSSTEEKAPPVPPASGTPPAPGTEDFGKGVIFYLRNEIVVGIVMWNVFNRMQIARQVLKDEKKYSDLNEVAKLFNIHED